MLKMTVRGSRKLYRDLKAENRRQQRALNLAIKVEGYRQLRQLREAIKSGRPNGLPYRWPLSHIARRTKTGLFKKNQIPLYRLARLLRYNAEYRNGEIHFSFGFMNTNRSALSGTWKDILIKHQEGVDVLYGGSRTELGIRFARIGARLKKKGDPDAKFFFLKKTTGRRIKLPDRAIVPPYWQANRAEAIVNIRRNFAAKLAGRRI